MSELTFGRPIRSFDAGAAVVSEVRYEGGDRYAPHAHDRAYLLLVCSGGFTEAAGRRNAELASGDVLAMPAGMAHEDAIGRGGATGLLVTLHRSVATPPRDWRALRGGAASRAMIGLRRALADGDALSVDEQLHDALAQVAGGREEPLDRRVVQRAVEILESESAAPLRLDAVAQRTGVTPSYLARAFRRSLGTTMGAWLRMARCRGAAGMLSTTDRGLAEIAAACGFADQSHLSRLFKRQYGITPLRYRRLMGRSDPFKT